MTDTLSRNESIKEASRHLRGTIAEGLADAITGAITEDDAQLTKFHGTYLQDDRDLRPERRKKKLEKAFSFMVRVRVPGGVVTPAQWVALDALADDYANGTLRLTTRQAFQFHGVIKGNLKSTMQGIDKALLDTLAACGDVNRNVMSAANPALSPAHAAAHALAGRISDHLSPQTGAYHEIWLDGEKVATEGTVESEPIYGATYLPRKFKIGVAVPPVNDVDVFSQDLGFIAVVGADGTLEGWDIAVGGGMGMTHGESETYPRTGEVMGFCTPDRAVAVAEAVVTTQRDFGDRANRKHARLKYTIDDRGLDWFRGEVERRLGQKLEAPRNVVFAKMGDAFGWQEDTDGLWHFTLFVASGRVADRPGLKLKAALREVANVHDGTMVLTPNQNVVIASVTPEARPVIQEILDRHALAAMPSGIRGNAMACVGLPTCGLAVAESERWLPDLVEDLEKVTDEAGLRDDEIVVRVSGCPNGCSRPYLAEVGIVGKGPGRYNLYLGAAFDGTRLNKLHREDVSHEEIVATLAALIGDYARERRDGERFGDFCVRCGVVVATRSGRDFHAGPATI